jgi:hypothetical protein
MQVWDVGREIKEKRRRNEEEWNTVYERKMWRVKHARKECQNMYSRVSVQRTHHGWKWNEELTSKEEIKKLKIIFKEWLTRAGEQRGEAYKGGMLKKKWWNEHCLRLNHECRPSENEANKKGKQKPEKLHGRKDC